MIKLENLYKTYQAHDQVVIALDNVSLDVNSGEIVGVIGESGAGKSTLIRCVNLLERPDQGNVVVDGQNLLSLNFSQLRKARAKIGMIFQHFNLLGARNVFDNIALPLELAGLPRSQIKRKVDPLLELVGLTARARHYPGQLSGGQKQRVAIARALANDPKVLLSDEATSALDPETKHSILQLIRDINKQLGLSVLLITHEMSVIKETCHRLVLLEQGKVIEQSSSFNFFIHPQSSIAKKFIRSSATRNLPDSLQHRFTEEEIAHANPLWRISFYGKTAEEALISHLVRDFNLVVNIIQAQIEQILETMVGIMLLEVIGLPENIQQGLSFLANHDVYVEKVGYVRSAY